ALRPSPTPQQPILILIVATLASCQSPRTEPTKNMEIVETILKWGFVAAPFIVILLIVLYANDMLTFTKPANPDQEFAERAMASARDAMKDPTSVKFKDLTVSAKGRCMYGQILGRNSFGAYNGYQPFVWTNGQTFIDSNDDTDAMIAAIRARNNCMKAMDGAVPLTIPEA
ncbi:hypothetical protein K7W03_13125, partial [Sphingobium sp. PNB]|uniref:hypothetical protein n=1 Tax=Sphingobium sp. PNB TaxID=863934 RepID=UPI001CA417A2